MNEWSRTRRRNALLIVLTVLIIIIAVPLYYFFQVKPTCFDKKQNGDETGVDCGGSCTTLCSSQSLQPIMKGDPRVLHVASSTYEVVAYMENPNARGTVAHAAYTFKLYEASSTIPLKVIRGTTYIPRNAAFAVFEGPVDLLDRVPVRASFEWDQASLSWAADTSSEPDIEVTQNGVASASSTPRIDAVVKNASLVPYSNIYLVTLVFDTDGTIAAASKTYVDSLAPGASTPVSFIWPTPFSFLPASVLVIPTVLPDPSYIR